MFCASVEQIMFCASVEQIMFCASVEQIMFCASAEQIIFSKRVVSTQYTLFALKFVCYKEKLFLNSKARID
jgi:hypothetical protein